MYEVCLLWLLLLIEFSLDKSFDCRLPHDFLSIWHMYVYMFALYSGKEDDPVRDIWLMLFLPE